MGNRYPVTDLLARYNMKQSAFSRFLNRHIKDINASGTHVTKTGGLLYFKDRDNIKNQLSDFLTKYALLEAGGRHFKALKRRKSELAGSTFRDAARYPR